MHGLGHSTVRAALVYQHATSDRDREIALGIDRRIARSIPPRPRPPVLIATTRRLARSERNGPLMAREVGRRGQ
jgi:hypothetical protein